MEPANIVLVTVPVSVVYTPFVTVLALPVNAPTKLVDVTDVSPAMLVIVAPDVRVVEPSVGAV
jgi:hypothetical protein